MQDSHGTMFALCGEKMAEKIARAFMFVLLFSSMPSVAATSEPVTNEPRAGMCEAFSGLAYGFCVALCEARECDLQPAGDERCTVLRRGFDRASGGLQPPC